MKIAIITYHYSCNHGAVMQTYGLCKFLKKLGHEVQIIDIRQNEDRGPSLIVNIAKSVIFPIRMRVIQSRYYPKFTRRYISNEDLKACPPEADCFIVGSDQVWNPNISRELMLAYFLDFGDSNVKRVSYASSFGLTKWPKNKRAEVEIVKRCLMKFDALSVREEEGAKLSVETFGLTQKVVLDPTFLNDDYQEIYGSIEEKEEIVCYKLNKTEDFFTNIHQVGKELNLPVALLNHNWPIKGIKYCFSPSLKTWMKRIAGASFVVTDSFHGIAFSLIFKRQFVAILNNNGKDSRLINLMRLVNLENKLFNSLEEMLKSSSWKESINYDEVTKQLNPLKKQSRQYLKDSLRS